MPYHTLPSFHFLWRATVLQSYKPSYLAFIFHPPWWCCPGHGVKALRLWCSWYQRYAIRAWWISSWEEASIRQNQVGLWVTSARKLDGWKCWKKLLGHLHPKHQMLGGEWWKLGKWWKMQVWNDRRAQDLSGIQKMFTRWVQSQNNSKGKVPFPMIHFQDQCELRTQPYQVASSHLTRLWWHRSQCQMAKCFWEGRLWAVWYGSKDDRRSSQGWSEGSCG